MMAPLLLDRTGISARIPHAGAMCLLDSVSFWDAGRIICTATGHRRPDHPLRLGGRLGVAAGIEYAAQAMAVHGSLLAEGAAAGKPPPGFLASARSVRLHVRWLDDIAADLCIEACQLAAGAQALAYAFEVHAADRLLLAGRASILLRPQG